MKEIKINPYFLSFLTIYVNDKRKEGLYSEGTINVYKSIILQFLRCLVLKEYKDFSNLIAKEVSIFIPYISDRYQSRMKLLISALRSFASLLMDKHLINFDMHSVLYIKAAKRKITIQRFTQSEADAILKL